jgi:hypothetical protein
MQSSIRCRVRSGDSGILADKIDPSKSGAVREETQLLKFDVATQGCTRCGLGEKDEIRPRCSRMACPAGRGTNAGIREYDFVDQSACTTRRLSRRRWSAGHVNDNKDNDYNDRDPDKATDQRLHLVKHCGHSGFARQ